MAEATGASVEQIAETAKRAGIVGAFDVAKFKAALSSMAPKGAKGGPKKAAVLDPVDAALLKALKAAGAAD